MVQETNSQVEEDVVAGEKKERQFASQIERVMDASLIKDEARKYAPIDYMLVDKKTNIVSGYLVIKTRTFKSGEHPDLMIAHKKMCEIRKKSRDTGLPIFIAIRLIDIDLLYEFNPAHRFRIEYGGRTKNTRTKFDIAEVEYIPLRYFRPLDVR